MEVVRAGDVDGVDARVGEQRVDAVDHRRQRARRRLGPRPLRRRADDADDIEAEPAQRLGVGDAHEPGADHADADRRDQPLTFGHLLSGQPDVEPGQGEHDDAVQHLLERLAHVETQQQPVEHREDEGAEDRAAVAARAAEDRRAADDGRGDGRQQVAVGLVDADRAGRAGEQQTADGGQQPGDARTPRAAPARPARRPAGRRSGCRRRRRSCGRAPTSAARARARRRRPPTR